MSQQDKPATFDQLKIGTRVKCIFKPYGGNGRTGELGSVINLIMNNNVVAKIVIKWDDDCPYNCDWAYASSFSIIDEVVATSVNVINDHICPTCQNDKCSKTEVTCWKCGNPL